MTPLFEQDGFIICFHTLEESVPMREYFIVDCGWKAAEFNRIKHYAWFCAEVSAWKDGKEVATTYLGCCCYRTAEQFYTTYKDDYFADMVKEVLELAKDKS